MAPSLRGVYHWRMKILATACLLSALALPAVAETAEDILGPAQPLQTQGSFSGAMMDNDSEVLTPIGIMDEDMFTSLEPAAGPIETSTTEVSPTEAVPPAQILSPTQTATSPTNTVAPPAETSPTTP